MVRVDVHKCRHIMTAVKQAVQPSQVFRERCFLMHDRSKYTTPRFITIICGPYCNYHSCVPSQPVEVGPVATSAVSVFAATGSTILNLSDPCTALVVSTALLSIFSFQPTYPPPPALHCSWFCCCSSFRITSVSLTSA